MYKESPLGWIPKRWIGKRLEDAIRVIDCKHFTPRYVVEGYPIIRPRNVKEDGLDFSNVDFVTASDYELLTDIHEPSIGDIVFSRNASFGIGCFVRTAQKFAIGQDVVIMTRKLADTEFISHALKSDSTRSQIERVSAGSTFGRINLAEIRELFVPLPCCEEQVAICTRLSQTDRLIEAENAHLQKVLNIKQGLMSDLLSGKWPMKHKGSTSEPAHV
jgi:type I restriction enzyme S subunit